MKGKKMKKNILFVMESLGIGGAEKSLVTLLSLLDKEKYDVSLYLFKQEGAFMNQIPDWINIMPISEDDKLNKNFKTDWFMYLKKGKLKRSYFSLKWLIKCVFSKYIKHEREYIGWRDQKHLYTNIDNKYDVAIGFLEKKTTYFVIDHVKADKKIAFMHTDYDAIPHDKKLDNKYFPFLDYLVVVSEHTKKTMLKHFPFMENKVIVIKNMISPKIIKEMSKGKCDELNDCNANLKIVTVGRLVPAKNIDSAIKILKIIRSNGIDAEWFVVGEGEERNNLQKQIIANNLEDKFHLIGAKPNPYPYMLNCDIYVQPSRWEGYGITVAEAKALCKPIVTSDIPEFKEQINNKVNGLICEDIEEMHEKIIKLYQNEQLQNMLIDNLNKEVINFNELRKFETLL